MKTDLFSISKIFTERLLRIPDYQRGYAWQDRHLKDFWNDLLQLEDGKNHYVGVLTLEDVSSEVYNNWVDDAWIIKSKNYEPHYIVDGQQRLTTSIILIQSILETIGSEGELNYTSYDDIRKKFIFETKDKGISRSYLFGYVSDNPSYEFLKRNIFNENSDYQNEIQETIYTNNLINAKEFFIERLKSFSNTQIESIYTKITQHFLFNIYSMGVDVDVHVSFETMNNRGKPLSHLELLKNRLIYLSTKISNDEDEVKKLRLSTNECWKTIYHQLGRNKDNPLDDDAFLLNHFILYFDDVFNKDGDKYDDYYFIMRSFRYRYQTYLLEEKFTVRSISLNCECKDKCDCEKALTVQDIYDYVGSLKSSVEKWYQICNPTDSGLPDSIVLYLERFNRLEIATDEVRTLLMVCLLKLDENECLKLFKTLEIVIFNLYFLTRGMSVNFSPRDLIGLACKLSNNEISVDKLIAKLNEIKSELTTNSETLNYISKHFKESGYYKWGLIKYFLYEYELHLKSLSKTHRDKINPIDFFEDHRDYKTVEHIYPQRATHQYWTDLYNNYTQKERSILRHSIGNLVPLSRSKNSSFQNKPFPEKISSNKQCVEFKYGSYSEIELTEYKQWTPNDIVNRGVVLMEFMSKRWKINFGTREEIIKFLNLDFVIQREK